MKLTILGCSGSVPVPGNAASGYLLSFDNAPSVVMDLGPGTLAQLQRHQDPCHAHVVFSHLHADHCLDFPSLMVWRRYHPFAPAAAVNQCAGPKDTPVHLGRLMSDDQPQGVEDFSDSLTFQAWESGVSQRFDGVTITPTRVIHPVETYALRVEDEATGAVVAYSADSAYTEDLISVAQDADVFLCEAAWGSTSEGKAPDMHMSGAEAGRIAHMAGVKKLVLVHLQPWGDPELTLEAARSEFEGEVIIGAPDQEFEF